MRADDPLKGSDNRSMVECFAVPQGLLAFLHSGEELLFVGDVGPQRVADKPRLAAPGRGGQPLKFAVEIGINTGRNGNGLCHASPEGVNNVNIVSQPARWANINFTSSH